MRDLKLAINAQVVIMGQAKQEIERGALKEAYKTLDLIATNIDGLLGDIADSLPQDTLIELLK